MKFTGSIYRPPLEADTPLLQVTSGCAHNKCTFCTMYKNDKFSVEKLEQIESDVLELKSYYRNLTRIFLVNGDAFVLSANKLKSISDILIKHFPMIETISMYASISNIRNKSDEDLLMLREARINDLWVGVESGYEPALIHMNKGHNLAEAYRELERLNVAGISHLHGLMIGVAGSGLGIENARATAELLNKTKPGLIWICSTGIFEGSELSKEVERGYFTPATEIEMLEEEIELINKLDLQDVMFYSNHPTNTAKFYGRMPIHNHEMINVINKKIEDLKTGLAVPQKKRLSL